MSLPTGASASAIRWLRAFTRGRPGVAWSLSSTTLRAAYAQEFCVELHGGDHVVAEVDAGVVDDLVRAGNRAGGWDAFSAWLYRRVADYLPGGGDGVLPAPVEEIPVAERRIVVLSVPDDSAGSESATVSLSVVAEPVGLGWRICGDHRGLAVPGWPPTWVDLEAAAAGT